MELDLLYRALVDYRKNTLESSDLTRLRQAIANENFEGDVLESVQKVCEIENDWVDAILEGLVFVGKAIGEERQFIRTNGEVVPIEKAKRISKDSIEHLARHSNLLTREPEENADIIPDQLYTVERLSDYTVYENRFLYMLLIHLRDFVAYRYEKIVDLTYTYDGKLELKKTLSHRKRKYEFNLNLSEIRKDDPILKERSPIKHTIDKIKEILGEINFYLSTPLMIETAKAPLLKKKIKKHFQEW